MNIVGSYTIRCGKNIIQKHNLITLLGESFFLNRAINNEFNPIEYIVLGDSSVMVKKGDLSLGNEIARKKCVSEVDLNKKQIVLSCSCAADEILGASEIGVSNGKILISHDNFENIDEEFLGSTIDSVEITYVFDLFTSANRRTWLYYEAADSENTVNNIYYTNEENNVIGVSEENSNSGYHKVNSVEELKTHAGAYYYDNDSSTLFIKTVREDNPNDFRYDILISTK